MDISNHNGDKREETVMEILEVFDAALAKLSSLEAHLLISEDSSWVDDMEDSSWIDDMEDSSWIDDMEDSSWLDMEDFSWVDDREDSSWVDDMLGKIHSCKFGLRFLKLFLWSLFILEDIDGEIKKTLFSLDFTRQTDWGLLGKNIVEPFHGGNRRLECEIWITYLEGRIQHCKQKLEVWCDFFLQCSLKCYSFENKTTLDFVEGILENLRDIHKFKSDEEIVFLKNQIATLMKKLTLLQKLVFLSPVEWSDFEEMRGFKVAVQAFAQCSAILIFMYWVREIDEEMATKLNLFLFNVLQKIAPCAPAFIAFYNRFLKEMKLVQFESLLLGQIVQIFLDLLLENLVDILKDDFQILEEGLMFVIAFLANPPHHHSEDEEFMVLSAEIDVLVKDDLYLLISVDDMKGEGNFSKINACLSNIMRKVQLMKGKVEQVYDKIRDSFSYDYPKINGLGFFDFLLQNLGLLRQKLKRDMSFIPFAKHLIIKIEEELIYMRPYLNDLFERQKDQKEQKDTWLKVLKLAYQTEYAINSCSVINHPLWYNMARLMEILNEIKVVNSQLEKIGYKKTQGGGVIHCTTLALNKVLEDPRASGFNEEMVGLDKELDIIIENLISGSKYLDIVAIVGMPGLGKTTMANKVYKSAAVRNHFHMFAYCVVSQVHNARKILLQILSDIKGKDDELYGMPEEDLADMLRKCLKGKKYLIILDDIWNVKAWDEIKRSLPNDQNGSRVIFTTRICNIAIQAKEDCILHELRFLSDDESWELLRNKTFREEDCPPAFLEVGKKIAKTCKGLPLTLVLIAGLLARTERSLSCWNKMSEAIGSYVSTEGCMEVLELSYQHLPEHLKPCFLYFGAFAEDKLIYVNKLMLLWIAEGFVLNSNTENIKIVAKEYLCDLIDRSLVIVNERSSYGGIKSCRIHDLVHEFCHRKAQHENFFQLMDKYEASKSSNSTIRNPYRVCNYMEWKYLGDATHISPTICSLVDSCDEYEACSGYDFSNMKLVQVMDLGNHHLITSSIRDITSAVHMRFIAISLSLYIRNEFLSSISNLRNLEILILKGFLAYKPFELPENIWNMTRLRHVDVGRCYVSNLGVKKHEAYPQMINLESFSSPHISSTKDLEGFLQRLPSLRKLSFHYKSRKHPRDAFHFPKLDSLSKLESLKVFNVGGPCLRSFNFFSTLKKLSLSFCCQPWDYLSAISKIPCLEVLKLLQYAFLGCKWDMEDIEFTKLKFLKMVELNLEEWIAYCESFPNLEVLIVNNCYKLNTIPPCFGEILTLKRIQVYASEKAAASVVEIHDVQKDFGNEELQVILMENSQTWKI